MSKTVNEILIFIEDDKFIMKIMKYHLKNRIKNNHQNKRYGHS